MYNMHINYDCKEEVINMPDDYELSQIHCLKVSLPYGIIPYTFYSAKNQADNHNFAQDSKARKSADDAHPCL